MLLDRLQRVAHNRAELRRLDGAGRLYATPHWRGGRYLYLIYPTGADGTRVRQYVGADRAKTAAALTAIANARRYDASRTKRATSKQRSRTSPTDCIV